MNIYVCIILYIHIYEHICVYMCIYILYICIYIGFNNPDSVGKRKDQKREETNRWPNRLGKPCRNNEE